MWNTNVTEYNPNLMLLWFSKSVKENKEDKGKGEEMADPIGGIGDDASRRTAGAGLATLGKPGMVGGANGLGAGQVGDATKPQDQAIARLRPAGGGHEPKTT